MCALALRASAVTLKFNVRLPDIDLEIPQIGESIGPFAESLKWFVRMLLQSFVATFGSQLWIGVALSIALREMTICLFCISAKVFCFCNRVVFRALPVKHFEIVVYEGVPSSGAC